MHTWALLQLLLLLLLLRRWSLGCSACDPRG